MSVLFFDFFFRLSGYVKLFSFKHVFYQLNSTIFVPICNTISYSIKAPLLMCNLHQEGYIIFRTTKCYVSVHFRYLLTTFVLIRNILLAFTTSCVSIFDMSNDILYTSSFSHHSFTSSTANNADFRFIQILHVPLYFIGQKFSHEKIQHGLLFTKKRLICP